MFFFLDINKRTIAFLASLFTLVQCILWVLGYILYMLAYSCGYNQSQFGYNEPEDLNLPLDFGSYYIWYLQGSDCITPGEWINHERHLSPTYLVVFISVGFSWNVSLLTLSIYLLLSFFTDKGNYEYRLKWYSYIVILVSIWDLILVVILSVDMAPLLQRDQYSITFEATNSTNPSIFVLPYFTEVYTVLLLLFSRLFFFWLINACFAAFLLAKTNDGARSSTSPSNQIIENTYWEVKKNMQPSPPPESGKDYFGQRTRNRIPSVRDDAIHDEVHKRWVMTEGRNDKDSDFIEEDGIQEDFQPVITNIRNRGSTTPSDEQWGSLEGQHIERDSKWRNGEATVLPNIRRAESITKLNQIERKPSFMQSIRQSFSKSKIPESKPPDNFKESFRTQKQPDGFTYIPKLQSPTVQEVNPLNIKLKHVHRGSIAYEENERTATDTSSTSGGNNEANPYLVSPLANLDPSYIPRGHINFPNTLPPSPPADDSPSASKIKPPPMPPAMAAPKNKFNNVSFKHQMSLQDEIRTMRPLKPVNRPAIDTNC